MLPSLATENLGTKTTLLPFERPIPAREIGLVYQREHYKTQLINALADSIFDCIPDELKKLKAKDLDVIAVIEK